ncbi:MAG: metallophosphoesterase family protein [Bacteroidota bacterium]
MRIGLLSDTHGHLDQGIFHHFKECEEIWHAGDIGTTELADELNDFKPFFAVHGNIDGGKLKQQFPEDLWLKRNGLTVWITHIGGYPPKYNTRTKSILRTKTPDLFICGHSHILKIMRDPSRNLLHINPGAAGIQGFHKVKTLVRFSIKEARIVDLEVIELGKRA